MNLNTEQLQGLSRLLDQVLDLPEAERHAWLANLSPTDAHLAPMLQEMLAQEANVETAFVLPKLPEYAESALDELAPGETSDLAAETIIGPYRLLRELGRGGMGSVWLAERTDGSLKRQVALKLPHSSLPQRQLAERFARERDILAALTHPHIARLYDAGVTEDGRPYLALEYVEGDPLIAWCDAQCLGIKPRLDLFLQVLSALQYAHGQLVVHRDLKPSNILVTAAGEVKLLDFGIAKLLTDGEARETELTQAGGRALTPQYASPEQILGLPIGTASDVYGLGVVLYELLTGSLPYRLKRDSRGALEDAILSVDPTRPSTTEVLIGNASVRSCTTSKLSTTLKGDLDTIILKALKKNPSERYATAQLFADDLRRYLAGEAVLAQPDSTWYRTGKFVRRNWLAVGATAAVVVALAVGLGIALWQAQVARTEAQTAKAVQAFLLDIFQANSSNQSDPQKARQTTARELLDIGAKKIDTAMTEAPEAKLQILKTLGGLYVELGLNDPAATLERHRIALAKELYGAESIPVAEALLDLAQSLSKRLDDPDWEKSLKEAQAILEAKGSENSLLRARLYSRMATFYTEHDYAKAASFSEQALAIYRTFPPDREFIQALTAAVDAQIGTSDWAKARLLVVEAIAAASSEPASRLVADLVPELYEYLGLVEHWLDHPAEAEAAFKESWERSRLLNGDKDIATIGRLFNYANLLTLSDHSAEGVVKLRLAMEAFRSTKGADEPSRLSDMLDGYANSLFHYGAIEEALRAMAEARTIVARAGDSLRLAMLMGEEADIHVELGRTVEATRLLDAARSLRTKSEHPDTLGAYHDEMTRLKILLVQHLTAQANELAARLFAKQASSAPVTARQQRGTDMILERLAMENGDAQATLTMAQKTIGEIESSPNLRTSADPQFYPHLMAGMALRKLGNCRQAAVTLRKALVYATKLFDPGQSPRVAETQIELAECLLTLGEKNEARALAAKARAIHATHKELGEQYREPLRVLEARLGAQD